MYDAFGQERPSYHDVALICLNGHVVNNSSKTYPQFSAKHCAKCGEATIDACPSCKTAIKGEYYVPGVFAISSHTPSAPSFCPECGRSFPWTERRLAVAKELADDLDGLSPDEKLKLRGALDDLVKEGPKAEPAQFRFKQIMKKVRREGYDMMKKVVTDLVSESVRKSIYGP
jgi:Uncharacterized protein conserved in bacteria